MDCHLKSNRPSMILLMAAHSLWAVTVRVAPVDFWRTVNVTASGGVPGASDIKSSNTSHH
jgi:hypothetical protein